MPHPYQVYRNTLSLEGRYDNETRLNLDADTARALLVLAREQDAQSSVTGYRYEFVVVPPDHDVQIYYSDSPRPWRDGE